MTLKVRGSPLSLESTVCEQSSKTLPNVVLIHQVNVKTSVVLHEKSRDDTKAPLRIMTVCIQTFKVLDHPTLCTD